ncbi:hypothetical protein CGLO_02634 [Colletotrichum gloeosporioides Cg-14]|uniref:Uncharacterized protein n=1 Tax=Colletotrichum gloeosporioides (strain Cg-14) TaxID=1237896 RepID=T0KNF2_COLGC|nr:hypothetical protein CGLO_02634 [Colletotrichum gloeosporioides Cg-14]
MRVLVSFY